MDHKRLFKMLERAERLIDITIERGLCAMAAAFGGWVVWTISSEVEIGLLTRLGVSLGAALICALAMWLFWKIATFLN